ncbi:MAG: hypothetical protein ACRC1U_07975, partial [Vibrionaceae bacterium]
ERVRAEQARLEAAREAERQAQIEQQRQRATEQRRYAEGRSAALDAATADINAAFGGYNADFYDRLKDDFISSYMPDFDREENEARRELTVQLGSSGNLRSTAAAKAFGDLQRAASTARAEVGREASSMAEDFRNEIDSQRTAALSTLFNSQAVGAADLPDGTTADDALALTGSNIQAATRAAREQAQGIAGRRPSATSAAFTGFRQYTDGIRGGRQQFVRRQQYTPTARTSGALS